MKAVVVTPYYFPKIGGLENYALQLNRALNINQDWEIIIVSTKPGFRSSHEQVHKQNIYRLGSWFKLSNTPINPLWPLQIRKIIRQEKPDLIMAHTPVPSMADAAALVKGSTPFVVVYHAATLFKQGSRLFNLVVRVYNLFGKFTLNRADHIFAVSEYVRRQFPANLQQKTTVVSNSVWEQDITSRPQPSSSKGHFVFIGSLDRSHSWKGLGQIIQAVGLYRDLFKSDVSLSIIGDGNKRNEYEKQVVKLGLQDNITFLGAKVGAEKTNELRRATALIAYPTTANDAFPTVILEAWSQYVPVITAAIGPLPSLINDQKDGYLCQPSSPADLAYIMNNVILSSKTSRSTLATAAAKRIKQSYTWEKQSGLVSQLTEALI